MPHARLQTRFLAAFDSDARCHTAYGMKMTMHIDDELLDRVMKAYGCESKTEAVEMALKEMDRRARLADLMKKGLGFAPGELAASVDPNYDLEALRVAEAPAEYGKRNPRR